MKPALLRSLLLAVLVIGLLSASIAVGSEKAGDRELSEAAGHDRASLRRSAARIPCLNRGGTRYRLRRHPRKCAIFSYGGSFGGGVNLAGLDWRRWGSRHARARGIEKGFHLPPEHIRVRVVAYRPVNRCGRRVYSRLRSRSRYGKTVVALHVCGGRS
jgi:hypothetical protein